VALMPGGGGIQNMQDDYKDHLKLLKWIAALVLLVSCANIANLLLVIARLTTLYGLLASCRRRLDCMEWPRTPSCGEPRRSVSAWRWGRRAAVSLGWPCDSLARDPWIVWEFRCPARKRRGAL
jgi:hypothetical protein